jgi:curved DNA-binding protein CbpA
MTDSFALLGQARRPWLDSDELKARYLALANEAPPDRRHDAPLDQQQAAAARYADLNAAYQCLREPKNRLLHLIELELGRKPQEIQNAPAETIDLFVDVGQLCSGVDAFLAGRGKVSSPILKAKVFEEGLEWTDRLQQMQEALSVRRGVLEDRLKRGL